MRLLLFNIQGQGRVTGAFCKFIVHFMPAGQIYYFLKTIFSDNSRGVVKLRGERVDRNGTEYVTFKQLDVKMEVGKSKFQLDNLFNGDPVLSKVGNAFVNENSELFLSELIPGLEKSLSKSFLEIVNVIMRDVTFDELFPDT